MSLSKPVFAGIGDSTPLPIRLIANNGDTRKVYKIVRLTSGGLVPSCPMIDNSDDITSLNSPRDSPITAPRLPIELLMCICDFLPDRTDIVNLSATCQELRGALYFTLVHRDLRSGELITLKYGLQTRNMRVIEPFFDRYRHLITRLTVTPKEKEVKPKDKKVTAGKKEVTTTKKENDKNNDKAGTTSNQTALVLPVRTRQPRPPTTIISFRDEHLPSLRLIRPLLTSTLEKALIVHDLTFAEHLLWHARKDLMPSLTPVLESVLWTAFNPNTCPRTGKSLAKRTCADLGSVVTPTVWTWKTCPLAAVKLLVKFGAKGNRAGLLVKEKKKTRKRRGFDGNVENLAAYIANLSPSERDEDPETPGVYDGYYRSKTETPQAHFHKPKAMPPGRLWTGLERVAFFYEEACERAAAAAASATAVAIAAAAAAAAGSADSGADVGPAAASASAGAAVPVAKSRGIKRNLSGSFRNPGSGSGSGSEQPSPSTGTGKERRHFFPVTCEGHDAEGGGEGSTCFKQLIEVLSESIAHDETTLSSSKGRARAPPKAAPFLEHDLDNMLKLTEITVPFYKMSIDEQAGKLFQEIFEEAEKKKFKELDRLVEKRERLEKNKKMKKTEESMTRTTVLEDGDEDEDFWAEQQELDLDGEEPEEEDED
ncbi:hypothetical protein N0V85_003287 [Neurospora sp. IMI 360204]|nr:hypothetical protein N0V85_003287 [Neurospora sp. IMI 360204]